MIGLSITFDGDTDSTVQAIEDIGGDVRNVFDDYVEAFAPGTALADLATIEGLSWAREFAEPIRNRGQVTSGGVAAHLAAHLADVWPTPGTTLGYGNRRQSWGD